MKLVKEQLVKVMIDDNHALVKGDLVKFTDGKKGYLGKFIEVTKKGALAFELDLVSTSVVFNIMPASIVEMVVIEHDV